MRWLNLLSNVKGPSRLTWGEVVESGAWNGFNVHYRGAEEAVPCRSPITNELLVSYSVNEVIVEAYDHGPTTSRAIHLGEFNPNYHFELVTPYEEDEEMELENVETAVIADSPAEPTPPLPIQLDIIKSFEATTKPFVECTLGEQYYLPHHSAPPIPSHVDIGYYALTPSPTLHSASPTAIAEKASRFSTPPSSSHSSEYSTPGSLHIISPSDTRKAALKRKSHINSGSDIAEKPRKRAKVDQVRSTTRSLKARG